MIQSNFPYERLSIINSSLDHKEIKPHTDITFNSLVGKLCTLDNWLTPCIKVFSLYLHSKNQNDKKAGVSISFCTSGYLKVTGGYIFFDVASEAMFVTCFADFVSTFMDQKGWKMPECLFFFISFCFPIA